jgi:hypothetical protein
VCEIAHPGVTIKYNAWVPFDNLGASADPTCGDPTNKAIAPVSNFVMSNQPYVNPNPGSSDFHLKPGTAAQDFVSPTASDYTAPTDIDGQARPMGAGRDAGSDEKG